MRPIRNIEDIENLKTDEKLIECLNGEVNYYRFLCFHPRNDEYVILLNHCEQPVRFYIKSIIDRCYTDYTTRDIVTYTIIIRIKIPSWKQKNIRVNSNDPFLG